MKRPRHTLEDVQRLAVSRGGLCLSSAYQRCSEHLQWQCSEGHRWQATYAAVRRGTWCPVCAGLGRRNTLEAMQALATGKAGRCLSQSYAGSFMPLEWECAQGHRWKATPAAVKSRTWCPQCARLLHAHTLEDMREVAHEHGGLCLSGKYVNNATLLEWECARGHRWKALPAGILSGTWCRQCYYDSMRDKLEKMQALAASRGGRCLSEHYTDAKTHLVWQCAMGHTWRAIPSVILRGSWCPQCAILNRTLDRKKRKKYLDSNEKA